MDTQIQDGVVDIDPAEEMAANSTGDKGSTAVATAPKPKEVQKEADDIQDIIEPKADPKSWSFREFDNEGKLLNERTYVQRPLSFFGKMKFFGLAGEVIDKSISGDNGLRLSSLFDMPGRGGQFNASDFRDADTFVQGVGKILTYAPSFLEDSYCIWLEVPDYEEEWAKTVMKQPDGKGGLSDDEGIEIIEIFIDQNWESLESFFREKIASLRARIQSHRKEESNDE